MTLFDNATNVVISNKEVASIKIGGNVVYTPYVKPVPQKRNIVINLKDKSKPTENGYSPLSGPSNITIDCTGQPTYSNSSMDNDGVINFSNILEGTWTIRQVRLYSFTLSKFINCTVYMIDGVENTTNFTISPDKTSFDVVVEVNEG